MYDIHTGSVAFAMLDSAQREYVFHNRGKHFLGIAGFHSESTTIYVQDPCVGGGIPVPACISYLFLRCFLRDNPLLIGCKFPVGIL